MGAFQTLTSTIGIFGLGALLLFLLCRYLGGWTRVRAWLWSSREEKMAPSESSLNLSGGGSFRRFENADRGSSSSAGGRGIAMKNLTPPNNNNNNGNNGSRQQWAGQFVPPPPLRPPSASTGAPNYLPNQGSVDSVFLNPLASPGEIPPKLPPPPNGGGARRGSGSTGSGSGVLAAGVGAPTNPFIPLIQASTQFFSQTIQSFQNAAAPNAAVNTTKAAASGNGISMGELLFSAPPLYNNIGSSQSSGRHQQESEDKSSLINFNDIEDNRPMPHGGAMKSTDYAGSYSSGNGAYPISPPSTHHPIASLGRSQHQHQQKQMHGRVVYEDEDNMILIETGKDLMDRAAASGSDGGSTSTGDVEHDMFSDDDETKRRDSLLESMRAEIRLENERMEDATKSLLMGDDATTLRSGSSGRAGSMEDKYSVTTNASSASNSSSFLPRPAVADRKHSAPEIGYGVTQTQQHPFRDGVINEQADDDNEGSLLDYVRTRQASIDQLRSSSLNNSNHNGGGVGTEVGSAAAANNGPASTSPAAYARARSFSLRQQSSVDSIGDISDLMSPESGAALPAIQRAMSCDSVCSDTSVILGDLDPPHVTGQLFVGLEYDSETADLIVNVIEGKDLLGLDPDPTSPFDSYVRVYLLPDKTTNMQTRIYRKSLSPVYKEKFMFGLEESELPTRSLVFYLYATNKHSNTLIGEAELKLNELDLGQPKLTWLQLTDTGKRGGEFGEIMFSLSYLPTAERLTVVVVKARNLKFPHERETGDPFVKVYLLQKGKKVSKKKSSTKRSERNPIFNEAMIFSVPTHALQTIQLRITVSDSSENDSRAYSIGHIIIGSASTGKPLSHWSQMLASLRKPIAMWHSLRK